MYKNHLGSGFQRSFQGFLAHRESKWIGPRICVHPRWLWGRWCLPMFWERSWLRTNCWPALYISENDGSGKQHVTVFGRAGTRNQVFKFQTPCVFFSLLSTPSQKGKAVTQIKQDLNIKERIAWRACKTLCTIMDWHLLAPLEPPVGPWCLGDHHL